MKGQGCYNLKKVRVGKPWKSAHGKGWQGGGGSCCQGRLLWGAGWIKQAEHVRKGTILEFVWVGWEWTLAIERVCYVGDS